jgi:uncharacterized caspase-like protein
MTFDEGDAAMHASAFVRHCGFVVLSIALGPGASPVSAQEADVSAGAKPRPWALLIGIEKYHRATPLRFTINDVQQLTETLVARGGYGKDQILQITDTASNPQFQPLKASIVAELPQWLKKIGPDDTAIIYFSGHGFRDAEGKMYLAPIDCDPANPAPTGIPVEWFREQIAACPARFKLLVIDACHAGSEKGDDHETGVAANELTEPFRSLEGVVTLASSKADEKSQIWEDKQQSLFSYWLNQGLKGHADEDGDAAVDIDELYKYVYRRVTQTAETRFPRQQTPVRVVRSGTPDVPVILRLQPQRLREVLADMAEQLTLAIEERQLSKVGVLEFTNDTKLGELLGADFGLLGKFCAEELERHLMDYGAGKFSVVDRERLRAALANQQFSLHSFASTKSLTQLAKDAGGMPVIVRGTLTGRLGRHVTLRCKLIETQGEAVLASVGGTAALNESQWAMIGRSAELLAEDRRPEFAPPGQRPRPIEDQVVNRLDARSEGPHPLLKSSFPFPIRIMINGKERKGVFRGNDLYVPVRQGETYEIWVQNRSGELALMRLLVDGLNTLPETEEVKGVSTQVIGKRVNLDEARPWYLDPNDDGTIRQDGYATWAIRGFFSSTGTQGQGKLREFLVVDADQSLAARQQFTDQIGIITAAFYRRASGDRNLGTLGTELGQERTENIRERTERTQPGNLIAVVHIRYVDADALQAVGR